MNASDPSAQAPKSAIVLYASMFGTTEFIAEQLAEELAARLAIEVMARDITWFEPSQLSDYELIVIGSSTWNIGQLPSDLVVKLPQIAALDLSGRSLALFGTGDQLCYPDTYLDAVGIIAEELTATGARLIGNVSASDYDFGFSLALRDGRLLGLGLDDDNEPELTAVRLTTWVDKLLAEFQTAPVRADGEAMHAAA